MKKNNVPDKIFSKNLNLTKNIRKLLDRPNFEEVRIRSQKCRGGKRTIIFSVAKIELMSVNLYAPQP